MFRIPLREKIFYPSAFIKTPVVSKNQYAMLQNVDLICGRGNLTVLQAITLEIESLPCLFYLIKFTSSGFFLKGLLDFLLHTLQVTHMCLS